MIAGTLAETIITLQIGPQLPQIFPKIAFTQKAANWPNTMKMAFLLTLIVRTFSGEISAKYIGDKLEAAPTAKPRIKRKTAIKAKFIEIAQKNVEMVNRAAIHRRVRFLPNLSAIFPHPKAPKHAPKIKELETTPCNPGVKFNSPGLLIKAKAPFITPVS